MTLADELAALREGVVWARSPHVVQLRVEGEHAFELLERAFSRDLYAQDGQLLHGLFLDGEGRCWADAYVGRDEDDFVVLAEGPAPEVLVEHLEGCRPPGAPDARVHVVAESLVGLHGPYAWELLAELFGPEVIGLPYLTFFRDGGITCYRTGATGEFGYLLSVANDALEGLLARLRDRGGPFDLRSIGLEALDRAAFESFFFCIRDRGLAALAPAELQLQWRLGGGGYVGAEALARRPSPSADRIAMARIEGDPGDAREVRLFGEPVGRIVSVASTPSLGGRHAYVLLRRDRAHPGIGAFRVGDATLTTVTPPPLRPRSLFVNAQRHTYPGRAELRFPPLLPEPT